MAYQIGSTGMFGGVRVTDATQQSYFATYTNRDDLLDLISNIAPWETPLFSSLPKVKARHVVHDWVQDTLGATSTGGVAEGKDFTVDEIDQRTRKTNICQIFRKDIQVTNTQRAVDPVGVRDEYAYQISKALKEIARNIETKLFSASGSCATGTTGAASIMKGLDDFLVTAEGAISVHANATGQYWDVDSGGGTSASATMMSEGRLNGMLQSVWENGGNPDKVFVSGAVKRQISAFSGISGSRRNIQMTEKKLVGSVDVYDSDFGLVQVVLDRWVFSPAAATGDHTVQTGRAYFLESGMQRIAVLRPIKHVPLPPAGDSTRGMVLGELTLEVLNAGANGRLNAVAQHLPA